MATPYVRKKRYTKTIIANFIYRVKSKARNSVKVRQAKDKENLAIEKLKDYPEVEEIYKMLICTAKEMRILRSQMVGAIKKAGIKNNYPNEVASKAIRIMDCPDAEVEEYTLKTAVEIFDDTEEFSNITKKDDIEVQMVEQEYGKLLRAANNRTPAKARDYLKELGFDISWIENEAKIEPENPEQEKASIAGIDKSKIFVCGDNKP